MVYGKQDIQEEKNLYVCFEVHRKNIFNLRFCIVIVNAPKKINALKKWLENTVTMCLLLTSGKILRLKSFVETGASDLENELFF